MGEEWGFMVFGPRSRRDLVCKKGKEGKGGRDRLCAIFFVISARKTGEGQGGHRRGVQE
jgi:hypothetical protein